MKVSKVGGFAKISPMAGSFQNRIAGDRRPLVMKISQEKSSKSARHQICKLSSTTGAPSHNDVSSQAKTAVSSHARTTGKRMLNKYTSSLPSKL